MDKNIISLNTIKSKLYAQIKSNKVEAVDLNLIKMIKKAEIPGLRNDFSWKQIKMTVFYSKIILKQLFSYVLIVLVILQNGACYKIASL